MVGIAFRNRRHGRATPGWPLPGHAVANRGWQRCFNHIIRTRNRRPLILPASSFATALLACSRAIAT
ncbi:hypothetical protein G6F50_018743 [Rhizopus delemar]|uniref:Uncharacterized protein n=1 Tax=Rhizopus delemar TaxID=936053 RepID=A0A9P6XLF2_9FUNG|nr:hypothetical protein G6F50_018743 [Rhizopus delemar]